MLKSILRILYSKIQDLMITYRIYYLNLFLLLAYLWLQYHLDPSALILLLTRFAIKPKNPV